MKLVYHDHILHEEAISRSEAETTRSLDLNTISECLFQNFGLDYAL